MHITIIAGTRPNFVKIAPIIHAIKEYASNKINYSLIHTGQHYDTKMSDSFFSELQIPTPDFNLNVGSGTQASQTAQIMIAFGAHLEKHPTDLVLVVGDVNSTMACAVVAKKMNIKLAHVEAGIRSFDRTMPEEINRLITDSITDYFFVTTDFAIQNLKKEGIAEENIFHVGNVMIDTLIHFEKKLIKPIIWDELNLSKGSYFVVTLHRPANVDQPENLQQILEILSTTIKNKQIVFPVHPRTKAIINKIKNLPKNIFLIEPLSYLAFNYLVKNAYAVVTDSGGITEETSYMQVPCFTLRDNTERPETCTVGTNRLIGTNPENLIPALREMSVVDYSQKGVPPLWDGKTSERIIQHIMTVFDL